MASAKPASRGLKVRFIRLESNLSLRSDRLPYLRLSVRVQLLELIGFRHGIEFNSGGTTPAYALSQERCQSMPLKRMSSDSGAGGCRDGGARRRKVPSGRNR